MDDIPHITLPIQIVGAQYATVQQDTIDEVAACVACIVSFPLGFRQEDADFGIPDPEFHARPLDLTGVEDACEEYEPRASVRIVEAPYNADDPLATSVQIEVDVETSEDT